MTFAIIRDRVILDYARHDSFWALAAWTESRPQKGTSVVILDLQPGESACVGARVDVNELRIGMASLHGAKP